jgi:hypothetical protein
MSDKIQGPYHYKGILNEIAGNSNNNQQAIVEFKGAAYYLSQWSHTGNRHQS